MTHVSINDFINKIPKAELHLHIEGTFEPELIFKIAQRNGIKLKYASVRELKKAYDFNNLQEFLDIYYQGAGVLIKERDFYDLTWSYLEKARSQLVLHAEIFFDPQTHTQRGIKFETVARGIDRALKQGRKKLGITSRLIMCFLRHLPEEEAFKTLKEAVKFKDLITAVGLDSSESGNPPSKFKNVYRSAVKEGFKAVAHAGEEGPSGFVREALDILKVSRIDHGNHALDDTGLVSYLVKNRIPLTVCPLSNFKLKVVPDLSGHPLKRMLELGLLVSVNSDDPAYFGGYVNENYRALAGFLDLTREEICQLAENSFASSFLPESEKKRLIQKVRKYAQAETASSRVLQTVPGACSGGV